MQEENKISYDIRGCAFKVHKTLGPGLFESVYEIALSYELRQLGYDVKNQNLIPVVYENIVMDKGFRADILVNDLVIIEVKSVENLTNLYYKQLLNYIKLSNIKLGLLINFNATFLKEKESIVRMINEY
ncbi:MAG TPA: GxxExxY protein [Ignavibacteria bacterium]|mgnify:FL=1|nr:GxxExxY protein [Ignavibacteria bacterium]